MEKYETIDGDFVSGILVKLCKKIFPHSWEVIHGYMNDKTIEVWERPEEYHIHNNNLKWCLELVERLMAGTLEEAKTFIKYFNGELPNYTIVIPQCQHAHEGEELEVLINGTSHRFKVIGREDYPDGHCYNTAGYDEMFSAKQLLADTTGSIGQITINYAIRGILLDPSFMKPVTPINLNDAPLEKIQEIANLLGVNKK